MTTQTGEEVVHTLSVCKQIQVDAPLSIVFESVLAELGPEGQMPDGEPYPLKLEAWPGGRWFRDLGNNTGHFWGVVQVIKPPTLLEISGPMFMSYPAVNFVQYRLTQESAGTRLQITHRAMGLITAEHREGVHRGWEFKLKRAQELAMLRAAGRNGSARA